MNVHSLNFSITGITMLLLWFFVVFPVTSAKQTILPAYSFIGGDMLYQSAFLVHIGYSHPSSVNLFVSIEPDLICMLYFLRILQQNRFRHLIVTGEKLDNESYSFSFNCSHSYTL